LYHYASGKQTTKSILLVTISIVTYNRKNRVLRSFKRAAGPFFIQKSPLKWLEIQLLKEIARIKNAF